MEAAAHAETDPLKGVSENILLGQLAKIDTGSFDLLLDMEKCASAMELPMNFGQDTFNQMMSEEARRELDQRDRSGIETPWIGSLSTTPSHWSSTTPQGDFSPSATSDTIGFSPAYPSSPRNTSPSPLSPSNYHPQSPGNYAITSPSYSPNSSSYLPTSPRHSSNDIYGSKSPHYRYSFFHYLIKFLLKEILVQLVHCIVQQQVQLILDEEQNKVQHPHFILQQVLHIVSSNSIDFSSIMF